MLWPEFAQVNVESTNEIEPNLLNRSWSRFRRLSETCFLVPGESADFWWLLVVASFFSTDVESRRAKNFVRKCQDDVIVRLRASLSCLNQMPQSAAINCSPLSFSFVGDRRWLSKPTSKLTLGASLDRSRRPVFLAQRISPRYTSIDRSIDRQIDRQIDRWIDR